MTDMIEAAEREELADFLMEVAENPQHFAQKCDEEALSQIVEAATLLRQSAAAPAPAVTDEALLAIIRDALTARFDDGREMYLLRHGAIRAGFIQTVNATKNYEDKLVKALQAALSVQAQGVTVEDMAVLTEWCAEFTEPKPEYFGEAAADIARKRQQAFRNAVSALTQSGRVVAEGWKLVPEKPTDAMVTAGWEVRESSGTPRNIYCAMLAAAPEPDRR